MRTTVSVVFWPLSAGLPEETELVFSKWGNWILAGSLCNCKNSLFQKIPFCLGLMCVGEVFLLHP